MPYVALKDVMDRLFTWGTWVTALAQAPIVLGFVSLAKPKAGEELLDALLCGAIALLAMLVVFVFCSKWAARRKQKGLTITVLVLLPTVLLYGVLFLTFTDSDSIGDRYVKGYNYTEKVVEYKAKLQQARNDGKYVPDALETDHDLVIGAGGDPLSVWTPASIGAVNFVLYCFFVTVAMLIAVLVTFVALLLPPLPRIARV
jgi:hypothetical protein